MKDDTKAGMASEARHVHGPRSIGALLPRVTRPAFRRRAPAAAQLMTDWPDIVGPALAVVTTPRRLNGGVLTLACSGPIALELQHLAAELISRVNRHVGSETVTRLRFVQDLPPPLPPRPPASRPVATHVAAAVEQATVAVPAGALRDALMALGHSVFAKSEAS